MALSFSPAPFTRSGKGDQTSRPGRRTPSGTCSPVAPLLLLLLVLLLLVAPLPQAEATSKKKSASTPMMSVNSTTHAPSTGEVAVRAAAASYTVTGCSECTVNASQRWCPTTMRCYPASTCVCEGGLPCIDLTTCFYGSRPTCQECVESGGVYCRMPTSDAKGPTTQPLVRCFAPAGLQRLPQESGGSGGKRKNNRLMLATEPAGAAVLTCSADTCPGGQCIPIAAACPAEPLDPLTRSYELIGAVFVTLLMALMLRNLCVLWSRRGV